MSSLGPQDFEAFFFELHHRDAFPWQKELAGLVCESDWPDVIDLPTASGKTASIDIALFALACRGRAPRRIFFVVDRKVIVDEAYQRVVKIAERLCAAEDGILGRVAARLRELAGGPDTDPLHVFELRGGIYRDTSWVRSPLQPTVVASTVDQVGSRILFRGYGVSDGALPIHAALVANDALILLDEAHCSKAFAQTLDRIQSYRGSGWAHTNIGVPLRFVEMTATPSRRSPRKPFSLEQEDREWRYLGERLTAPKPTRLIPTKAKTDESEKLAAVFVTEARGLVKSSPAIRRVAIMVNRVATARSVYDRLGHDAAILLTGRMRPVDRDDVVKALHRLKSGELRRENDEPVFVVATQCLEVGADMDFDGLVTECASMDALLQRFGRVDRLGKFRQARGCIVVPPQDPKKPDPVYGEALAATREWLEKLAGGGELDFGVESSGSSVPALWKALSIDEKRNMTPPAPPAPELLPSHLDTLVQTSPRPEPEPAVGFFLHGREPNDADVQVVWRADLDGESPELWADIIRLCPPVVAEALPVKLWALRRWMNGDTRAVPQSDVEGYAAPETAGAGAPARPKPQPVLVWRKVTEAKKGESPFAAFEGEPGKIRPGDTIVLPLSHGGGDILGHIPGGGLTDVADRAYAEGRRRVRLRLHPALIEIWPEAPSRKRVLEIAANADLDWDSLQEAAERYRAEVGDALPAWLGTALAALAKRSSQREFQALRYPNAGRAGWLLEGRRALVDADADQDEGSAGEPVFLELHTTDVRTAAMMNAGPLSDGSLAEAMGLAAEWHDAGKADSRFQTLLHGGDAFASRFAPKRLAKGRFVPRTRVREHWERSGLPEGFRHELLSLSLAEHAELSNQDRDLILHLIASHHGRCRPFAPVVIDDTTETVSFRGASLSAQKRRDDPPHHLASGVPDRFWRLTRTYGWWGLAYLEALFRLSDWKASAEEQRKAQPKEAKA